MRLDETPAFRRKFMFRIFKGFFKTPMFEGEVGGGAGTPAAAVVDMSPPAPLTLGDYWERDNKAVETQPVVEPAPAQPVVPVQVPAVETQPPEKILGRFENQGELVKGYQNIQSAYTKDHQALLDTQKVLDAIRLEKADLETKIQTLSQPPKPPEPEVDEFDNLDAEAIAAKFYEDPKGFAKKIEDRAIARAEKVFNEKLTAIEGKINPVVARDEEAQNIQLWESATKEFQTTNPDMAEFVDGMKQYISEKNLANSKDPASVLKEALTYAKGLKYQPQQVIDPKSYLQDEKFVQENILNNPVFVEQIVKNYLAGVRTNQQGVPLTITGNSSSNTVATPLPQAKSIREGVSRVADKLFPT
jgi:hypothetical protein